jgi:uncharacterized protein
MPMRTQDEVAAMACPVCRVPLAMSDRQGIEIDYCPQCRGVWLDRGELDKIIERSTPEAAGAPQHQASEPLKPHGGRNPWDGGSFTHGGVGHGGHAGGHDYAKPRKRRSWLEDIFD